MSLSNAVYCYILTELTAICLFLRCFYSSSVLSSHPVVVVIVIQSSFCIDPDLPLRIHPRESPDPRDRIRH